MASGGPQRWARVYLRVLTGLVRITGGLFVLGGAYAIATIQRVEDSDRWFVVALGVIFLALGFGLLVARRIDGTFFRGRLR